MSKFKVGDMVRTPGEPGTIIAILGDSVSPFYTVRNHLGVEWNWSERAIEPQSWPERPPVEPARCGSCHNCSLPCTCNGAFCNCRGTCVNGALVARPAVTLLNAEDICQFDKAMTIGSETWLHESTVARLRKELEAAKNAAGQWEANFAAIPAGERECRKEFDEQLSKLRAFSEDQARQIQKLEEEVSQWRDGFVTARADQNAANADVGRLTRELDKLKRAK